MLFGVEKSRVTKQKTTALLVLPFCNKQISIMNLNISESQSF
jgi:hypothetical protein